MLHPGQTLGAGRLGRLGRGCLGRKGPPAEPVLASLWQTQFVGSLLLDLASSFCI